MLPDFSCFSAYREAERNRHGCSGKTWIRRRTSARIINLPTYLHLSLTVPGKMSRILAILSQNIIQTTTPTSNNARPSSSFIPLFLDWTPRQPQPLDYALSFGNLLLIPLLLCTPLTPTWRIIRAAVFAPLTMIIWAHVIPLAKESMVDQWGSTTLMAWFMGRCLMMFVLYPLEESAYRLKARRQSSKSANGSANGHEKGNGGANGYVQTPKNRSSHSAVSHETDLEAEPVPPPWTLAKFYWANSLWWSWRGIGWSYCPPLPPSSTRHPFSRDSTRKEYLIYRFKHWIIFRILSDFVFLYMNLSKDSPFFLDQPGAKLYTDMTQWERAKHSLIIVGWVIQSLDRDHIHMSFVFVGLGGLMGWEGEMWSPWGWPPMFGGFRDIWENPGLSFTWSRVS